MTPEVHATPVLTGPSAVMASWSFYLGVLGFLAEILSPVGRIMPVAVPLLLLGGLGCGVLAVVLGAIGLFSLNRISALAGLILGFLTLAAFYYLAILHPIVVKLI